MTEPHLYRLAALLTLCGCGSQAHSPEYFNGHPSEASAVANQCAAGTNTSADCATAAQSIAHRNSTEVIDKATKISEQKSGVGRKW